MIKFEEAFDLLDIDASELKINAVWESDNYFIFDVVLRETNENLLAPSPAIDKRTGKQTVFNPMVETKEERKSLKRIY